MDISIESLSQNFEDHLLLENNHRIIFSGKFGMGKTFFLQRYFQHHQDQYNTILLSPVNYVVSSNENIFELIKADILKELFLTQKIRLTTLAKDTTLQRISNYIEKSPLVLPRFLAKVLAKINPAVEVPRQLVEDIVKMMKEYSAVPEEKYRTLTQEASDFVGATEEAIGGIYEYNYITKAINIFLEEIREEKKNVLIIDDFDRIDPEHIFRILNILSAHNNSFNEENKFNFDHIIIVCDIINIKNIFAHKYGANVDFDGYIDKFFSSDIFHFQNSDAIKLYIAETFGTDKDTPYTALASLTLQTLIDHNFLTVRRLLKHRFQINVRNFPVTRWSEEKNSIWPNFISKTAVPYVDSSDLPILSFFKLMSFIYGSFEDFYRYLSELSTSKGLVEYENYLFVAGFLAFQQHILAKEQNALFFSVRNKNTSLEGIEYPEINFNGKPYRIIHKWSFNHPYKGEISYFNAAKAEPLHISNDQVPAYQASPLFNALKIIANTCYERGLLQKAGIHLSNHLIRSSKSIIPGPNPST
ncbi:MAG TPA: P-loop NTPase fold protein [Puia sp.]|nr:P-loop NTPase fold protein [Puia sp.]